MMSLQARPYVSLREAMDRLFDTAFTSPNGGAARETASVPVNVFEDGDTYRVQALVPGATAETISVTAQPGGYLTISGESKASIPESARAVWSEYGNTRFRRDIALSLPFNADEARVTYANGVLDIVLPKSPEARPRAIKVLGGGS